MALQQWHRRRPGEWRRRPVGSEIEERLEARLILSWDRWNHRMRQHGACPMHHMKRHMSAGGVGGCPYFPCCRPQRCTVLRCLCAHSTVRRWLTHSTRQQAIRRGRILFIWLRHAYVSSMWRRVCSTRLCAHRPCQQSCCRREHVSRRQRPRISVLARS